MGWFFLRTLGGGARSQRAGAFWDPSLSPVLSLRPEGQVRFLKGTTAGCGLLGKGAFRRLAQVSWASLASDLGSLEDSLLLS